MRGKVNDPDITLENLMRVLEYDPMTGRFRWLQRAQGRRLNGEAGARHSEGYRTLLIDGQQCLAHRVAWFYMTGAWPTHQVDHRNTIKSDNRWSNLRPASHHLNQHNRQRAHRSNKTGLLGVSRAKDKFVAQIQVDGKKVHIGSFDEPHQAHAAYLRKKAELHEFWASR